MQAAVGDIYNLHFLWLGRDDCPKAERKFIEKVTAIRPSETSLQFRSPVPVTVPDPEVATPLSFRASQENALVLLRPIRKQQK